MADTNEAPAAAPEPVNTKCTDSVFLMECLKNLHAPASIDINAVAKALGYGNVNSAANRARSLKKKFNLQITPVSGSGNVNSALAIDDDAPGTPKPAPASPKTPRKGAKAARGPIKAKGEAADAGDGSPAATPAKRGRKPGSGAGRKPKAAATKATKGPDTADGAAEPQTGGKPAEDDNDATA